MNDENYNYSRETSQENWVQIDKISQDTFGYDYGETVDISSNKIIVGAPGDDTFGGIVYFYDVYNSSNNYDITSNTYDEFGISVAIYNEIALIGTSGSSSFVYQYESNNDTNHNYIWNQVETLSEANSGSPVSAAISCSKIILGAPYDTINSLDDAGSAYIFDIMVSETINNSNQCNTTDYSWINSFANHENTPTTTSDYNFTSNSSDHSVENTTSNTDISTSSQLESQLELIAMIFSATIIILFFVSLFASCSFYYYTTCRCKCNGSSDKMVLGVDKPQPMRLFAYFVNTLDFWLDAIFAAIAFVSIEDMSSIELFTIEFPIWLLIFTLVPHLLSSVICLFVIVFWRRKDERSQVYLTRYEIFIFMSSLVSRFYGSMSLFQSKIFLVDLFHFPLKKIENIQLKRLQLINIVILQVYKCLIYIFAFFYTINVF